MFPEILDRLVHNPLFLNTIVALAGGLVLMRFFAFVVECWRDGLTSHFQPCSECHRKLAPSAWFCPHCGHVRGGSEPAAERIPLAIHQQEDAAAPLDAKRVRA